MIDDDEEEEEVLLTWEAWSFGVVDCAFETSCILDRMEAQRGVYQMVNDD